MKTVILLALVIVSGVALAEGTSDFMKKTIAGWFGMATPVGQGIFLTDQRKCLYSVVPAPGGLQLITLKDEKGLQLCEN